MQIHDKIVDLEQQKINLCKKIEKQQQLKQKLKKELGMELIRLQMSLNKLLASSKATLVSSIKICTLFLKCL